MGLLLMVESPLTLGIDRMAIYQKRLYNFFKSYFTKITYSKLQVTLFTSLKVK